jgi:hypothetical protein
LSGPTSRVGWAAVMFAASLAVPLAMAAAVCTRSSASVCAGRSWGRSSWFWCDVPVRVAAENELTVLVDRLRWDRRRDPYAGGRVYSRTAREVADRCARLIDAGEAAVAVPALRKAVDRMTSALMYLDSSSGILGTDLAYLTDLYARACRAVPSPPTGLRAGW